MNRITSMTTISCATAVPIPLPILKGVNTPAQWDGISVANEKLSNGVVWPMYVVGPFNVAGHTLDEAEYCVEEVVIPPSTNCDKYCEILYCVPPPEIETLLRKVIALEARA